MLLTTGTPRTREEVETILTSDVRLALERFQSANSALLDQAAAGAPDACWLDQARQAKAAAARDLRTALRRHNAFILDHEVPEDLVFAAVRAKAVASE